MTAKEKEALLKEIENGESYHDLVARLEARNPELLEWEYPIPEGFVAEVKGNKVIIKKKFRK